METLRAQNEFLNPVFLTGFAGSGKSTLGPILASRMDRVFFDLDKEIEKLLGESVVNYIRTSGEDSFRDIEDQVLRSTVVNKNSVIALGGGTLIRDKNLDFVKSNGCLIWLSKPLEVLSQNLEGYIDDRPLIKSHEVGQIEILYNIRTINYQKSNIVFNFHNQSLYEAADQIWEKHKSWVQNNTLS